MTKTTPTGHEIKIGGFYIKPVIVPLGEKPPYKNTRQIWIENQDGEGGSFDERLLSDHIRKFYEEHF